MCLILFDINIFSSGGCGSESGFATHELFEIYLPKWIWNYHELISEGQCGEICTSKKI